MSQDDKDRLLIDAIPKAILLWRLSIVEEVLLSGFQLELYVKEEKSFVYWELSQVIHEHLSILDSLEQVIPQGRFTRKATTSALKTFPIDAGAYGELTFVRSYLTSFQSLCTGMYMVRLLTTSILKGRNLWTFFRHSLCFRRCIIQRNAWRSTSHGGTNGRFVRSTRNCAPKSRSRISRRSPAPRWRS